MYVCIREATKRGSSLIAGPLRGGGGPGGVKDRPLRKKYFFYSFFNFVANLSKYGHITLKFVGRYYYLVDTIFSKK